MTRTEQTPEAKAGVEDADLSGRTVLVTGSTSGVGEATALSLGRLGADVIVHGRNRDAGERVVDELESVGARSSFFPADFSDPDAVSGLADDVRDTVDDLDVLCNNAGGFFRDNGPTSLGVGFTFHVNHLAPFQLTAELLPALAPDARVITTASVAHRGATLNLDTVAALTGLSPWAAYCRSKLANVQFANELARRFEATGSSVTSNSLHPGVIPGSGFVRGFPEPFSQLGALFENVPVGDSVIDGAATPVYLAASDEIDGVTGTYFTRCRERRPAPAARDPAAQRRLWERSAELLGIDEPLKTPETTQ